MKEQLTEIPNIYSETPDGKRVIIGVANGILNVQNKDDHTSTFIGPGFIKLQNMGGDEPIEIDITVLDSARIVVNGENVWIK